ncbi:hypothetical protein D3C80_1890460 [compost metagenome]
MRQGVGFETVDRRLNRGRCHQMRLIAIPPGMQDLQGDFAALFVYCVRHYSMLRQLADIIQHRTAFHSDARQRGRDATGHNQCHAVTGALGVKCR